MNELRAQLCPTSVHTSMSGFYWLLGAIMAVVLIALNAWLASRNNKTR